VVVVLVMEAKTAAQVISSADAQMMEARQFMNML
jgi:hypothetical protein